MKRALLIALITLGSVTAAPAQSTIQPIVVNEAKDHAGCFIYLKADGTRLMFQGKPISARGNCPADFLPGNVARFGADSYRLRIPSRKADCIVTPQGLGRCQPGVIDDRPKPNPPATRQQQVGPSSEPVPRDSRPAPDELVPRSAPLPNPGGTL